MSTQRKTSSAGRKKNAVWKAAAYIILLIQIILSVVALVHVLASKMIPTTYILLLVVVLWVMLFLAFTLMVLVRRRKGQPKKILYLKRGLGTSLSIFTIIICWMVTYYLGTLNTTISNITVEKTVVTDTVAVYVRIDDAAASIQDAADYSFGLASGFDYENSMQTIASIEKEVGHDISVMEFEDVFSTVDALLGGQIDAMLLNYSYEEIISDMEGYETFTLQTKVIYEHSIETIVETPTVVEEEDESFDITKDTFAIYLSGSDTRSTKLATSRSDVNIVAFVNPSQHQVLLVNTPRDYYVPISISRSGDCDKLTHCGIYGVDCSMDTLENLYETNIKYYMQINFEGFMTFVDAIGGITIESEKSFTTLHYDVHIKEGTNELDGIGTLGYIRERYAFADGDNARGRNTMKVVAAIIKKCSSGTTILSKYGDIMKSLEGMFVTNMSSDDISTLVRMQLSDMSGWDIRQYAVTGTGDSRTTYSVPNTNAYVMIPDQGSVDKAIRLINKIESGELITDEDLQ